MPDSDLSSPGGYREEDAGRSSGESTATKNIPRKPLPGGARPITPEQSPARDGYGRSNNHNSLAPPPVPTHGVPLRNRGRSLGSEDNPSARGPPPWPTEDSGLGLDDYNYPPEPKSRLVPELQRSLSRRPVPTPAANSTHIDGKRLPPTPVDMPSHGDAAYVVGGVTSRSPSPRKPADSLFSSPFKLTLIRRDPSTGNQWNVGRISSYQTEAPLANQDEMGAYFPSAAPVAPPPASSARPPINIQIDTLGYAKFRHMPMPTKKSLDSSRAAIFAAAPITDFTEDLSSKGGAFSRQVAMSYSKSWKSNIRDKVQARAERDFGINKNPRHHARHSSVASAESTGSVTSNDGHPGPGMKPRGYVFTSPWDGRCEFRTGSGGRSLRCYHILHDSSTSSFNPLVAEQQAGGPGPTISGTMAVSELRFNLPGADLFKSPDGRLDTKTQIQGHFNKIFKVNAKDDSDDDEYDGMVSPFEVNLGKEKAGGGNRGKRAKLGKLIIYPDGLKMLDLIVAANIGVWWGAWERSY